MSKKIRCFLFSLTSFKKLFVVFYFRWFFQRIQRINEINETNSTNQRIRFSLIWPNFNEFSTKNSTNQRKFQQINENSEKNLLIRWNVFRNQSMLWKLLLIRWKFGQFIGIFIESSSTFLQINENFIRWFVEFVDDFSNQYFFVDFVFQINEFNEINIFFSTKTNQRINIFNEKIFFWSPGPKYMDNTNVL